MTDTRILESRSLPDIDLNFANAEPVIKASQDYLGVDGIRQMVSFKPMQNSSAFRLWCKALDMDISEYDDVAKDLGNYKKEYDGKYKNDPKWGSIIKDSQTFKGVIESISPSPCSYLLLDKPISEEIGLMAIGSDDEKVICCCLDGYNCDVYKYLKNDYLIVTVWDIISKVYQQINQPIDDIKTLLAKCDDKVWDLYANGITATLNQADSDYDKQILTQYKPHSFEEMSAYVAAIRPGFASQLNSFVNREDYSTGVEELDNLLADSFHYIMYQENVMTYLTWLGIPEKETYDIIKKISKKKFTDKELNDLKERLRKGWIKNIGNDNGFQKTWEIVELNAKYSFNASHSASVALDSLYGAYLKSHYPLPSM
jgi:DNA polymerase III alpha subunit